MTALRQARREDKQALLAVHLAAWTSGVSPGQQLVRAALRTARARGARKVSLRVLAHNEPAKRLYESCGFVLEGTLREEFFLDGRYVDDLLLGFSFTREP